MPLIVVENLHKSFVHMGRKLNVLRGIDMTIEQGEVVAIVGPSGAGKSTLLHCIGTLDLPSTGKIRLGDDELTGLSSSKLASTFRERPTWPRSSAESPESRSTS